jgi:hypothetical protein
MWEDIQKKVAILLEASKVSTFKVKNKQTNKQNQRKNAKKIWLFSLFCFDKFLFCLFRQIDDFLTVLDSVHKFSNIGEQFSGTGMFLSFVFCVV